MPLLFTACGKEDPAATTASSPNEPTVAPKPVPKFEPDSAYAYVARQVAFGPRTMNSPAHDATRDWLVEQLNTFGAEVEEQNFNATGPDGTQFRGTNVIGRFKPALRDRILLAAHWDTRYVADSPLEDDPTAVVEGADDGASGVGVLLEIARHLGNDGPEIGVDIVFLDAEDQGASENTESWGLGAQHYARTLSGIKPRYGILLDMVGGKDPRFAIEGVSQHFAPQVVQKVWGLAAQMGYGKYYVNEDGGAVTDDHYFINQMAGIPTIDIINRRKETESGFVLHWHTGDDGMDAIDKVSLGAAGQVVLAVIYREAAGTL
ncbi:M28 family peptidase [Lewinella sp. W8]|uniref:M28 family peptidase n=1 Tax=Lewinella sp. W8 TaxID=2528208 RepID=UPI0020A6A3F9|nr:M28 family peptidase [Lewinella sp. W8]